MDPIRTLIVDDESLARENLRLRLRGLDDFVIVGECASGSEAIGAIAGMRPDLVFLDIRMPDLDGFSVIERIDPSTMPAIVFITAFDRYAIEAFRVHALDYLLKPIEEERFAETLQACRQRVTEMRRLGAGGGTGGLEAGGGATRAGESLFQLSGAATSLPEAPGPGAIPLAGAPRSGAPAGPTGLAADPLFDRLVIKTGGRVFFLRIGTVDWIEAYGDYVRLHVGAQSYLLRRTMNEMETRLPARDFARTSRSAIVNLDRVKDLEPASRGELLVRLTTGRELKLTRVYREKLERLLGDRL
jgi:two-component system, LytTR family, response regulator